VMLVKDPQAASGPHYVLVRDSFGGQPTRPSDWTLWCLADEVSIEGARAAYTGQWGVDLDVHIIEPQAPSFQTGQYGHEHLYYNHIGGRYMPDGKFKEYQKFIRLEQPAGKGFFAVLYPHKGAEARPVFNAWGGGAGVSAHIAGVQHVAVMAEKPGRYAEGDVVLVGQRAVVREGADEVVLALLRGSRLRCGEFALSGAAPCELTVRGDRAQVVSNLDEPATLSVELPAGMELKGAKRQGKAWLVKLPAGRFSAGNL